MNIDWGTVLKVFGKIGGGRGDSKALKRQARMAYAEGFADEQQQRRETRQQMGVLAASLASNGLGYGGSSEYLLRDSALNAELDALNYRYRGLARGRDILTSSRTVKRETGLLAGAELLMGNARTKRNRQILKSE